MISTNHISPEHLDIETFIIWRLVLAAPDRHPLFQALFSQKQHILARLEVSARSARITARHVTAAIRFLSKVQSCGSDNKEATPRPLDCATSGTRVCQARKRAPTLRSGPPGDSRSPP